jgi:hypothetical protein
MGARMFYRRVLLALGICALTAWPLASQNPPAESKFTPKLEPIAETKLLMEGLIHANYRGLERILNQRAPDAQGWTFARGQALLIAEGANLLMLRPPKNQGQQAWFERSMELRSLASQLAQIVARKDLDRSRMSLQTLTNSCNRCHQTFRVPVQIAPRDEDASPRKAE